MRLLTVLALAAVLGCSSAPTELEAIPPVEYEVGFTFDFPCQEHGSHTQLVSGSRLVRIYEITVEGEVQGEVSGDQIASALEMIEILNSIQVVPVVPEAAEPAND